MDYVQFGKTGLKVSRFGLGCMRLPQNEKDAVEIIRYALDNGVNYIDTAYLYKGNEALTGKALKDGYRSKTLLATKSPIWNITRHEDFEKYLDEELKSLGTDVIDVYLLHNLNHDNWKTVKKYDGLTFLDKMVQKGKIRHKGFSAHTTLAAFQEIVDCFDWEMAQIQLNILDAHQQAGVEGLRHIARKGMAAVIMEPLRGGYVLGNIPEEVYALLEAYPEKRSFVEWCFRWLYDMPETTVILSGTSTLEQLRENLEIFEQSKPNVMSERDQELIRTIRAAFEAKNSIGCTGCRYCMPCPAGVSIPDVFRLYNNYQLMKTHWVDKGMYRTNIVQPGNGADKCVSCGVCRQHCPQGLDVPELLQKAHAELTR